MKFFKLFFVAAILLVASCKPAKYPALKDGLYADIETNRGDILLELYQEDVPLTVANFVSLAEGDNPKVSDSLKGKEYYDGLSFHRVLKDFMIQGGDPAANGSGGPGYVFEDEFPKDSLGNLKYRHDAAGVLSMANGGPGSNGSQFFITHKETPWLDGIHSIFGKVNTGQDIVNLIEAKDTIKHVTIIRVGTKANSFDAAKVFTEEVEKSQIEKQKRFEEAQKAAVIYQKEQGIDKAVKTLSGLKVLTLKEGKGKKFSATKPTTMHYHMLLANGKSIQSTFGGNPFTFTLSEQPMIKGVNEAIVNMREGGKVRLFIPYNLGYGEAPYGPFPAKSDLVFELEILKVGK
ncbi:MAG: peptidylprolyl isomerase [Polaribacter sp.]|nr:peptidylprolyl isomerase [Polaribacter sp.]MDG1812211.1 peptidylprolyl isomerase [Polaribacter sp.]MDG1993757.1 peptidylprolyl isomerase [Polaribacter sp.]